MIKLNCTHCTRFIESHLKSQANPIIDQENFKLLEEDIFSRYQSFLSMSSSSPKAITTKSAPAPVGPYNQAVFAAGWLYCSGQIPLDPSKGEMVGGGDIQAETNQVIKNLKAVLNAAGGEPSDVVKTTIYLLDLKDFEKVNKIYAETFSAGTSPARACVQVAALPKGARIEIDCIAFLG